MQNGIQLRRKNKICIAIIDFLPNSIAPVFSGKSLLYEFNTHSVICCSIIL